jgi:hypothetical protein
VNIFSYLGCLISFLYINRPERPLQSSFRLSILFHTESEPILGSSSSTRSTRSTNAKKSIQPRES